MKICQTCDQLLAEAMAICPSCGDEVVQGRNAIDDYAIVSVLQDGFASILCKAEKEGYKTPVLIRLFKDQSGVNEQVADRLRARLQQLNQLSDEGFVKHYELKKSSEGLWYRVSEWVDGEEWSSVFSSGIFKNYRIAFDFFHQLASSMSVLHSSGHFMPHLVLSDIIAIRDGTKKLKGKIDFKLSRFLNHNPHLPGTMLNDLLNCHPDIVNKKPLDFRSDIWSLGKIFIELLTTDLGGCPVVGQVEALKIPRNSKTLLKTMLAQDPSLRPQSMKEVADSLARILIQKPEKPPRPKLDKQTKQFPEVQKLRKRIWNVAALFIILMIMAVGGFTYFGFFKPDMEVVFQEHANRYSNSVAFVLVEYVVKQEQNIIYRKRTEGTAFLVDNEGYLVTNRHVAAPWLLDRDLHLLIGQMNRQQVPISFDYRMYLWFEGQKAYQRIPTLENSQELADIYYLKSAYRSYGKPRVEIAGIERSVIYPGFLSRSPLRDDFAVLKIDAVPPGLKPIPLDDSPDHRHIKKLSPVITIGFPLGSRAQANSVNVSVTKGNVRRIFEDMIQVDTSIYKGNSGGPIIDAEGKAIGIATGIMFDTTMGMIPVITPLSDIGMVLPIRKTVTFLEELKSGQHKWNGVLDISIDQKVEKIKELAMKGKWKTASGIVDNELKFSLDPKLITAAGFMHFCQGDYPLSKQLFERVVSMDPQYYEASLMVYLIDWLNADLADSPYRKRLLDIDWRSSAEFYGYLTRILEENIDLQSALQGWHTQSEKSWIYYIAALVHYKYKQTETAHRLLRQAAKVAKKDDWVLYLILAELKQMQDQQLLLSRGNFQKRKLQREIKAFYESMISSHAKNVVRREQVTPLYSRLLVPSIRVDDKIMVLKRLIELDPGNKDTLISLAFFNAMEGDWQSTLQYIDEYISKGTRENKAYLSIRVLELGVLKIINSENAVIERKRIETLKQIKNPWYRSLLNGLSQKQPTIRLTGSVAESPEYLLISHFALGFWAEGSGRIEDAINHYKEALSTYLDGWWEYEFAKIRIRKLRSTQSAVVR